MFSRILIANRGEIACRIARTCSLLGIEYVAVYSVADTGALHLEGAAETVCIGAGPSSESYLNADQLIEAAKATGCQAIHPGYGFLSENASFAHAIEDAGLAFIGPRPETIEAMGDKARSKAMMRAAGVPVVPGSDVASEDPARLVELADEAGFPVLLKPTGGGGGKGMVVIENPDDLIKATEATIRQAKASFGDGRLLIERFITSPRHIEIQVFGDGHGNVVHLFERECSLQRRHQKVIEEAPASNISDATRSAMRKAAVQGAEALGYRNAGTFEFIYSPEKDEFFFLEVNTRLQVEHPVTEAITGLDLVEWQLRVAAGDRLPLAQDAIVARGHAMEARICAEDPLHDFRPAPGYVSHAGWPDSARVDTGVMSGGEVPAFYDPMIAKIIVHEPDRETARHSLHAALLDTQLIGVATNIGFLASLLTDPDVIAGTADTGLIARKIEALTASAPGDETAAVAAALELIRPPHSDACASPWFGQQGRGGFDRQTLSPEAQLGTVTVLQQETPCSVRVLARNGDQAQLAIGDKQFRVEISQAGSPGMPWLGTINNRKWTAAATADGYDTQIDGWRNVLARPDIVDDMLGGGSGTAVAPLPGVVSAVLVEAGAEVTKGQVLAVVEAMKMENAILAHSDGTVEEVLCTAGDTVASGQPLVRVAAPASE
ncbi:acetyl/propionyl-CoA carboxylase alpha subunit [Roseovarius sp. MBR-51]